MVKTVPLRSRKLPFNGGAFPSNGGVGGHSGHGFLELLATPLASEFLQGHCHQTIPIAAQFRRGDSRHFVHEAL
jgi:hypothetical protein